MNVKKHGKSLRHNVFAAYPLIEALISISISVTLLTVFFFSTINVYKIYDRPEADLEAKSIDVMERLLAFPGQDSTDNLGWEDDPGNIDILGLKVTPTVAYGIIYVDPNTGEVIPVEGQYTFSDGDIGVVDQCFIAGTKVLMADGSHKNIESIYTGDMVTAYDVQTGEFVAGRVTHVFQDPPETMLSNYYLVINKNLRVTPDHLMFSDGEWVPAGDLSIGDCLFSRTQNIEYRVYSVERIYERVTTFNLEIEQFHTYFVSIDNDVDVLVHNPLPPMPLKQEIIVGSPGQDDILFFGSSFTIKWTAAEEGTFKIELYFEVSSLDTLIADNLNYGAGTSHSYPWSFVTANNGPGSSYQIKITDTNTGIVGWSKFFSIQYCTLTITIDPADGGSVTQNPDPPYNYGEAVTLEATPSTGYAFDHWEGDLSGGENLTTITMNSDKTVRAYFTELSPVYYTLTVTVEGNGIVIPESGGSYLAGTVVVVEAIPDTGWIFESWSGDLSGPDNTTTITMNSDKAIIANFDIITTTYTLTMAVSPPGAGVTDPSTHTYIENTIVEITAIPNTGYKFDHWEGDLSGGENPKKIIMNSDKIVTTYFINDPSYSGIHAEFVWFDTDGIGTGSKIFFNASKSVEGNNGETWYTWWWNWTENKGFNQSGPNLKTVTHTYPDDQSYTVRLKINDSSHSHSCIYTVQVNTFQKPNIEPWAKNDMETFPENDIQTTAAYDEDYYVTYTNLDDNYHLYEIKEKTGSPYTILDYKKISSLNNINYYTAKTALGLNTSDYVIYNFNISISDDTGVIFSYGASYTPSSVKASNSIIREVLIYYSPEAQNEFGEWAINRHPKYEKGEITVRIFLGGIPPE